MSITSILQSAYSGLSSSQAALRSVSNNIANVNTENYGREVVHFETASAGSISGGVRVSKIERASDQFLEKAVYASAADVGRYEAASEFHSRLQALLGSPDSESSLPARLDSVFASVAQVSADPADAVRRQAVLASVERFTEEVGRLAGDIQTLRADASNQLVSVTASVNELLNRIHKINPLIVRENLVSGNAGALEEQRSQAINQLSQLIDVRATTMPDGSIDVATTSGVALVDKNLRQLDYLSPGSATPETNFPTLRLMRVDPQTLQPTGESVAIDADVRGGKIRGLLDLRDLDLPAIAAGLGEMAHQFTNQVNAIHNANTAVPPPPVQTGRQTGLDSADRHGFTGTSTFLALNAQGAVVAKTTIDFGALSPAATVGDVAALITSGLGGAGSASFTAGKMTLTGAAGLGLAVVDSATSPAQRGGKGFSHFFGLNDLVTSVTPLVEDSGLGLSDPHRFAVGGTLGFELRDGGNRLTATAAITVAGGSMADLVDQLNSAPGLAGQVTFSLNATGGLVVTPATQGSSLRVVSDSTARAGSGVTLSQMFGLGLGNQARTALDLGVRADVKANPFRLALAKADPATPVGTLAAGAGDQRGATALRDLGETINSFSAAGNIPQVQATLSQYMSFVVGDAGLLAERADVGLQDGQALKDNVVKRRDDAIGVNIDEELSSMLVFQNSYSAAARLMSTARDMYDTLLTLIR